ncbi:MAG: RNA-binding protein [Polyangiaceae bacterium]|nr:RNA-binding protein [Polyangiaceae bacterium]
MKNRLFVGNLSVSTEELDLRNAFSPFGELLSLTLVRDRETSQSRGFGFIEFRSSDDAARAQRALDGQGLKGHSIVVSAARDRRDG